MPHWIESQLDGVAILTDGERERYNLTTPKEAGRYIDVRRHDGHIVAFQVHDDAGGPWVVEED